MDKIKKHIAETFLELAEGLETGKLGKRPVIALTGLGSEHGEENTMKAAVDAAKKGIDVLYIGTKDAPENSGVTTVKVAGEEELFTTMEELLKSGRAQGAVAMHYPFPIGVSTVGRSVAPATGKDFYIANTTGTSSTVRIEGMILNAIAGIITAKACGNPHPTVGILNLDGARQVEMDLKELAKRGYEINFAESARVDGGCILRGNDVLLGTPDVLVCDSLTGNVLTKMLSAASSGGRYETVGYGYGPGIGKGYHQLVLIASRASGAPLITNAIGFAAELVEGGVFEIAAKEYAAAEKAGLQEILDARKAKENKGAGEATEAKVEAPPHEVVTSQIAGIDVMDLEDAVQVLWKAAIYAEDGMGCTGPIIRVSDANLEKAKGLLKEAGYIGE